MSPESVTRLSEAREQLRLLEDTIFQAREQYGGGEPRFLSAYLTSVLDELYSVRDRIDAQLGLDALRVGTASLWLRLRGGRVGEGRAPAHVVGRLLESIQKGVRQAGAFLELGTAVLHKVPKEIGTEASLDIIAFAPGSVRIAVAPSIPQYRVDKPLPLADLALQQLVAVVLWAQTEESDHELDDLLSDPAARRQALSRIKDIAPSSVADYGEIELSGPIVNSVAHREAVVITSRAYGHASNFLKRRKREPVTFGGKLVAIDIEKALFDLRHKRVRIHCYFSEGLLSAAKGFIEEYVEVQGIGLFHGAGEIPYRIDVLIVRRLSADEAARLR